MQSTAFPIFDLGAYEAAGASDKRRLGNVVDDICRSTGFLAIANHGISDGIIQDIWATTKAFFDLPAAEKQQASAPYPGYPYGYLGPGTEALAKSRNVETPPDLKESFNGGPLAVPPGMTDTEALSFCYAATIWPSAPKGFTEAWKNYYSAMEDLAARIMRVFATALQLDEHFFDAHIDAPISALRALNYPEQAVSPEPGQLRAGAHTDYGSLTILLPQPGSKGLEIIAPDGSWTPVPPVPGAFVINIGDLMALWTNDRWVSTMHRVVNPSAEEGGLQRRQSLAFFHQPNWFSEISCLPSCVAPGDSPKYAPVLSGPYLMGKFKSTVTGKAG
ncbi:MULTISPECIES: isopenicillin N synthase family dioxygenase [unclassified Rhizobium]|uniref:isopenicillin N synthase family dioxygenase n=1 Tax=unclassified Rhizobium TaxID=2613769 RepID=UPI001ADC2659|nr:MULTISPECIES: 2OG-Fe(II) oxygenase family protein [unclassified Rhizobium]MBO9098802.1 isopenicillin N synthase family oxygenase [Rhizobium sp. L58/93]MBO9132393.1 isopenicillin N synthase family oxygenase [Rhizobium sp. B209b/85]MBO9169068.1 isopenicillin N synthase family oxygenase [Rhizobium sp. L245/93]MBO9185018.1 isopenicillin N synthase family oxygenase [Rhizobium sp. E27B/91]QXZ85171.1 isopenicillin N synthase family oxygenase [Rhizobium sp. K1/93]